eukprot:ANDGO_06868.mRNA.1 hypothetical protein
MSSDCARRALVETLGGQAQTFHPVVPTEAERQCAKISEALHQFIDMDVLEEAVSFFGKAGRPAALCPEEERRLYHSPQCVQCAEEYATSEAGFPPNGVKVPEPHRMNKNNHLDKEERWFEEGQKDR